jgi:hypothetical protein
MGAFAPFARSVNNRVYNRLSRREAGIGVILLRGVFQEQSRRALLLGESPSSKIGLANLRKARWACAGR